MNPWSLGIISIPVTYLGPRSPKPRVARSGTEKGNKLMMVMSKCIFNGTGDIDTKTTSLVECIRLNDLWMELVMDEEQSQKNGIALILDVGGLPMRLLKFLSPKAVIISAQKEEVIDDYNSQ